MLVGSATMEQQVCIRDLSGELVGHAVFTGAWLDVALLYKEMDACLIPSGLPVVLSNIMI